MSNAKKLNEGTVTSLADTDLIVAADNGGSLRPISVTNLMQLIRDNIKIGGRNLLKTPKALTVLSNRQLRITDGGYLLKVVLQVKHTQFLLNVMKTSLASQSI